MILEEIFKRCLDDVKKRENTLPYTLLKQKCIDMNRDIKDVKKALRMEDKDRFKIIAEVKKASPSKGVIRENFNHLDIAIMYEKANVDAISVLTEPHYFLGSLKYLNDIRQVTNLPLIRKDFISTKYQILEAYLNGADFILLIAKLLNLDEINSLMSFAKEFKMEVLLELHDKQDLDKALDTDANIIGINHRNLETFEMDMHISEVLIPLIPKDKIIVAESGLNRHEQLVSLSKIGVDAFLIGEHFMREDDIISSVLNIKGIT